jgi:hypothetical protein
MVIGTKLPTAGSVELCPEPSPTIDLTALTGANTLARNIETLILMGHATSGVILSTVRLAFDLDYTLMVVEEGCADRDPEVHSLLMEKVFPRQATVVSSQDLVVALAASEVLVGRGDGTLTCRSSGCRRSSARPARSWGGAVLLLVSAVDVDAWHPPGNGVRCTCGRTTQ